jgi:hypothetical protein
MTFRVLLLLLLTAALTGAEDDFLHWGAKQAKAVALATRVNGQVGGNFDFRVIGTDRSYNYKLRATWMTPQVIRATARLQQLAKALTGDETRKLVTEAEAVGEIVIQVEIDPREGSGVIPNDWVALLGPRTEQGAASRAARGISNPKLRDLPALAGAVPRDYAYEVFWVVFPAKGEDGQPLFSTADKEAELSVGIRGKLGKVRWPVPGYICGKP